MKVYIVTFNPFPNGMAATNRILHYGRGVVSAGVDCEVVVGQRTEFIGLKRNEKAKGVYKDVYFTYPFKQIYRSRYFVKRRIDDFIDYFVLLHYLCVNVKRGDVVLQFSDKTTLSFFLQLICYIKGGRKVRELCELPFATRNDRFDKKLQRKFFEKIIFPRFDGVLAISQALKEYAMQFLPESKIIKVPILIDPVAYDGVIAHTHSMPYIFHGGTMYERKDAIVSTMKAYVSAMNELSEPVDFILAGPESPHQEELDKILQESNLTSHVHFIGQLKHDEILSYQKGAILSILNKNDNPQNQNGFSTKLGDILLAGTPVITTTVGEANYFLKDGVSAYITEPHNPEAIAQQIVRAMTNEEERRSIGQMGKIVALQNFDYRKQGERIVEFFKA